VADLQGPDEGAGDPGQVVPGQLEVVLEDVEQGLDRPRKAGDRGLRDGVVPARRLGQRLDRAQGEPCPRLEVEPAQAAAAQPASGDEEDPRRGLAFRPEGRSGWKADFGHAPGDLEQAVDAGLGEHRHAPQEEDAFHEVQLSRRLDVLQARHHDRRIEPKLHDLVDQLPGHVAQDVVQEGEAVLEEIEHEVGFDLQGGGVLEGDGIDAEGIAREQAESADAVACLHGADHDSPATHFHRSVRDEVQRGHGLAFGEENAALGKEALAGHVGHEGEIGRRQGPDGRELLEHEHPLERGEAGSDGNVGGVKHGAV
jgi:hypothetical protein